VERKKAFDTQLALLIEVRDYSEHGDPHHSVLILQGTMDGGLVGTVGLHLAAFVEDLKQKSTRTPRARLAFTLISKLRKDASIPARFDVIEHVGERSRQSMNRR
jgi:hypothetical protein